MRPRLKAAENPYPSQTAVAAGLHASMRPRLKAAENLDDLSEVHDDDMTLQ